MTRAHDTGRTRPTPSTASTTPTASTTSTASTALPSASEAALPLDLPFDLKDVGPLPGPTAPDHSPDHAPDHAPDRTPDHTQDSTQAKRVDTPWDIRAHAAFFTRCARAELAHCPHDPEPEHLKLVHTMAVLGHARGILRSELASGTGSIPERLVRPCLLAALYHDLGRFAQYRTWHTFKDALSCNHGLLSARLLEAHGILAAEDEARPGTAALVCGGVSLHNAFALPGDEDADVLTVARLVRDADKLDILRVMDTHLSGPGPYEPTVVLGLPDDPALFSPKVLACVSDGTIPSYGDLVSVNDFRVLLGTWLRALEFPSSRRRMIEAGHARHLVEQLPQSGVYASARSTLLALL